MTGPVTHLRRRWSEADADVRRFTRAALLGGLASLVVYVAILWGFSFDPLRTAYGDASFSNFYDVQAHALLNGELHLPEGELGIEAFVVDGKDYMYFPPGPSILRMPIAAVTDAGDGLLTAPSMLVAWTIGTVFAALLIWRVRRIMRPSVPLGRGEAWAYGGLLASAMGGSVVVFLASMPFVYHEAYSWAIATSLGAAFCILGLIEQPTRRSLVGASVFTLGAVLCRTTAGWACAGALVLAALWFLYRRPERDPARPAAPHPGVIVAAALAPLAVGIAFNWAKFRHPYMFPLEKQVWTTVNEQRRLALDANGGDLVSLQILPSTVVNYFRPDGIRFTSVFPWITLPARPAPSYGGSFLDQTYRTGSVTAFMPLLFLLSIWGVITSFRPKGPTGASSMRIPLLGMAAIPGAILFYGYIAYRYTSELVPLLVFASAIGLTDLLRRLAGRGPGLARAFTAGMAGLALFGLVANVAVAVGTSRINNSGPPLKQYIRVQEEISKRTPGDPFLDLIHQSPTLPTDGPADRIQIVGECEAVYVGTGDPLWPWMPLESRELGWDVDLSALGPEGVDGPVEIVLATPADYDTTGVILHLDGNEFRGTFDTGHEVLGRRARPLPDNGILRLRLVVDLTLAQYVLVDIDNPRRGLVDIENSLPQPDWFRQQLIFHSEITEPTTVAGVTITPVETAPLEYCEHLRRRVAGA